ncbi:hypothetical protein HUZ36_07655 [Pseudoalteromonas sp. McH1-7]|uniref:hypothetical protein n=1 Tax=Pseudoalteromonas sp. McH1-7 TaxID=2745574 RepID=UPI0015914E9E|nr:hypothetical protein [Pseudoalteromonas sp. McH1-7]NUZ10650.1 hypothetical protein [Pseudoalteromonas sp. McH1-7]
MISNKKSVLALSVASALVLSGCFSDDDDNVVVPPPEPTDPVVVPPESSDPLALVISANVVDRASNDIVPSTIRFLEGGAVSSNIVDVDGNAITSLSDEEGAFIFTKKEGAELSEVTIRVSAEGYFSKDFTVALETSGDSTAVNTLLPIVAKTGDDVSDTTVEASVGTDGTTTSEIVAETTGKAGASAKIPSGVVLQDADGTAISGAVSLNVSGADSNSSAAALVLPAGLNTGNDSGNVLQAIGVSNVVMTAANGKKVKKFSSPITVSMSIPAGKKVNGVEVKTGDMLNLRSHNEDTGVWSAEEQMVTVGALNEATNTYNGTFQTDHLTFFAVTRNEPRCDAGVIINTSGALVPSSGLLVTLQSSDMGELFGITQDGNTTLLTGPQSSRVNVSSTATASIRVFDFSGNTWFQSNGEIPVCGTFDTPLTNPVTLVSENVAITATCTNDSTVSTPVPAAVVRYARGNSSRRVATNGGSGTYTLSDMVQGQTYTVSVKPRIANATGPVTATITADGTAETINVPVTCSVVTGA